ncbi:hypothetical protein G7Y89_g12180 [Cudoniella acicularis]|uniref:Tat pathway signal sequence n=1 Tax=Cudoniella acicularis TaxID=354080 RepID=A0A8H4RAK6_9HELO|nr:hypothetical protein G7Y89_g12180 [Cudoniella acicularis]
MDKREPDEEFLLEHSSVWEPTTKRRLPLVLIYTLINIAFSLLVLTTWLRQRPSLQDPSLRLFSPANDDVQYLHQKFTRSRGEDKSPYQGWPNDDIDALWRAQYFDGLLTTVDEATAMKLPEETSRFNWPSREDEYILTLDVFHQMHCLDVVRMALYRDRYDKHFYNPDGSVDYCKWLHIDHCVDQVRQAIMCAADVSVVYFEWSDVVQGMRPRVDNSHTCRDYSKILQWAKERHVPAEQWHPSHRAVRVENGSFVIETGRNQALPGSEDGECNAI